MCVAVLGASGFVGTAVTAALARRLVRVRAVSRRPARAP
ncbi:NAD(P)-dependent oxidoreductase, partial [Lentzea sp. PSKA42]|nr:NAD(P)-dependent oxidoreductase [Lentzea indica]